LTGQKGERKLSSPENPKACEFKSIADYGAGSAVPPITARMPRRRSIPPLESIPPLGSSTAATTAEPDSEDE
jgi:hypothetical protein